MKRRKKEKAVEMYEVYFSAKRNRKFKNYKACKKIFFIKSVGGYVDVLFGLAIEEGS